MLVAVELKYISSISMGEIEAQIVYFMDPDVHMYIRIYNSLGP